MSARPSLAAVAVQGPPAIVAESPSMKRALHLARRFAPTRIPILLVGATGTGKELFAQHIHAWSGRRGELVDVNCGALPKDLVEGLLFGHRRGAFTGAVETVTGLIEAAREGTLFLDEVCSLPAEAQVKLLRVLETGEVRRLGESVGRRVDFRLVAAAQEALAPRVAAGTFRMDLYQRIAGVVIGLPALVERLEDLVPLARWFAAQAGRELAPESARVLAGYGWPGNVRELRLVIERAGWLTSDEVLGSAAIAEAIELGAPVLTHVGADGGSPSEALDPERARLVAACHDYNGDPRRVATALGIGVSTLYRRLESAGLRLREFGNSRLSHSSQRIPEKTENVPAGRRA